ncbi:MAG: hypothetical protein ACRCUT_13180 [Spirochaetota bacterium]
MKRIAVMITAAVCAFVFLGAADADNKKSAPVKPAGIYDGINTGAESLVIGTYDFSAKTVKVSAEKESFDCEWKIDGNILSLYLIIDNRVSSDVYESWIWNAVKKRFEMKEASGIILKKKGK